MNPRERYVQLRKLLPEPEENLNATKVFYEDLRMMATFEHREQVCDFKLHSVFFSADDGSIPLYESSKDSSVREYTPDIAEASVLIEGTVRFDGCANWSFPGTDVCLTHTCNMQDIADIGLALLCVWRDSMRRIARNNNFTAELLSQN